MNERNNLGQFVQGMTKLKNAYAWVKGMKMDNPKGEKARNWKGDKAGYRAIHDWVSKEFGTPKKCERCGTEDQKRYEWSSNQELLLRDRSNWERLCVTCHRRKDRQNIKNKQNNTK